jgi:thiamine pyrophosphate-dependent acetolactate synthase large subunit-like protein
MKRHEAVDLVGRALEPRALVVACNGMIGRELHASGDAANRFYMIGSMGLASSIGLGLALAAPARRVVVLDGDGNVLMGLGALASVAAAAPPNFYHFVFDNHAHGSTGDQGTISGRVPLERLAAACGYTRALRAGDAASLAAALPAFFAGPGPAMLLVEVERGNVPGIPRIAVEPATMARRFRAAALAEAP